MVPGLIGISTTIDLEGGDHRRPRVALYAAYMSVFEQLGLACVLITPAHTPASARSLAGRCDGLVLSGGDDVAPSLYGEAPLPELGAVNPARDEVELAALDTAAARGIPLLAICRGCQLLNVYLGGTLYQDIATQRPGAVSHEQTHPWGRHAHAARVDPDSQLARQLGASELRINSYHHQAIKDLAPPLRAVAWSEDGLIEGVEHREHPWVLGVQWHPERHEASAPDHDPDRALLLGFGRAVLRFAQASEAPARRGN